LEKLKVQIYMIFKRTVFRLWRTNFALMRSQPDVPYSAYFLNS